MPRAGRRGNSIVLNIPRRLAAAVGSGSDSDSDDSTDSDFASTCCICSEDFCTDEKCGRTMTHMACCTHPLCCTCLARQAQRCMCTDECTAVVCWCAFCKTVSPVDSLDLFLSNCKLCKWCRARDAKEAAAQEAHNAARLAELEAGLAEAETEAETEAEPEAETEAETEAEAEA